MDSPENKDLVKEPDIHFGHYSYADYLTWQMDEMVELVKGKVFKKAASAPRRIHQKIAGELLSRLNTFLKGKKCEAYIAPFDVRLPIKSKADKDVFTVVQPDICVVCDPEKLDEKGCLGAPDLIVEVLSPGNKKLELKYKYEVYEESGVKEYWIIEPESQLVTVYTLIKGKYQPSGLLTSGDVIHSSAAAGFSLDLEDFFNGMV